MSFALTRPSAVGIFSCIVLFLIFSARPTHAFGAGNIGSTARIEGQNWRHGDIEDTLLTLLISRAAGGKKFSKMDVKRVYFGNWLRDYSQAVDVGTVKYVSAEAIRILLWVLGFLSFGYGTKEFEVTSERLGCYRPEEHIDNPKDYADNIDARHYDRRLRGPVDERKELSIDQRTGLKHYIASEDMRITTSAGLVRDLFGRSIFLGRRYAQSRNQADLYEALRLLGTGCHCLEDYSAHSNYTELALIELGERGVFPHVGRRTQVHIQGARQPVFPIVTGTFGGVDFLHSVCGEFSDKAAQSEIQELDSTLHASQQSDTSLLKNLLGQLPSGLFGDKDHAATADELQANAAAAQMQAMSVTPKEPEAWTRELQEISKQIYPVLEFHDELMQSINEAIEQIPVLPDLIEQIQEQVQIFVFSLIAPFVLPIINEVQNELQTGSEEIIQSSKDKQLIVFHDDSSTDPTHSMLSKDHFSNVLNEPAGRVASSVLTWVVPQLIAAWDDERIDPNRTITRIINGVFHHPAMRMYGDDGARDGRNLMFGTVERWWGEKSESEREELRAKLSREGVERGDNHKEGVSDSGHGCGKPMWKPGAKAASGSAGGFASLLPQGRPASGTGAAFESVGKVAGDAVGGGALGTVVGGLVGGVGASLLGGAFGEKEDEHQSYQSRKVEQDGSYTQSIQETAHRPGGYRQEERYGQAEYKRTEFATGGSREEYDRYEQDGRAGRTGYGFEQSVEQRPMHGGGFEQITERKYERPGGVWDTDIQTQGINARGEHFASETKHHGKHYGKHGSDSDSEDSEDGDDDDWEKRQKKERKKREKEEKRRRKEEEERRRQGAGYEEQGGNEYGRHGGGDSFEHRQNEGYNQREGYGGRYETSTRRDERQYGGGYGEERSSQYQQRSSYGREYEESRPTFEQDFSSRDEYREPGQNIRDSYGARREEQYEGGYERREERSEFGGYGSGYQRGGDSGYGRGEGELQGGYGGEDEYGEQPRYGGSGYSEGYREERY
ncbi:Het-C-domain-containing protein [Viridothelium virens]|uniref:Het-C-domain-containing protein n=1 Tax=Viridothelium virens TaxID=1048519 RepID=A0A6A6H7P9_VIRVR|nr:Het-C-domain-containing protein [Viridothelium virens]